jgi:hypothetical protein
LYLSKDEDRLYAAMSPRAHRDNPQTTASVHCLSAKDFTASQERIVFGESAWEIVPEALFQSSTSGMYAISGMNEIPTGNIDIAHESGFAETIAIINKRE